MKKVASIIGFLLPVVILSLIVFACDFTWLTETSQLHGHEVSAEMSNGVAVVLMIAPAMLAISYACSLIAKKIYVTKLERAI